ncbi:MAG: serine hydrolase domain-containing protein [Pseudomonadales bacterium]|nr:serine hydrolase domain-containing protein [Pseudomonadales bacterium]
MKPFCLYSLLVLLALPVHAAEFYFPGSDDDWETVDPAAVGWNAELLSRALDVAGARNSSGVVILHQGRILAERYWQGPDNATYRNFLTGTDEAGRAIEDVASAQKSVVAVLTGIAQQKGFIALDDPVNKHLEAGWSQASREHEEAIILRHLLSMTSGLAEDLSLVSAPGQTWFYNTPAYHMVMRVLTAATGKDRNELTSDWLSKPLGMTHTSWTSRPWADAAIGAGLSTTARDLARFGLMIQAGGQWQDQVVMADPDFLQAMLSPSQTLNPAYGYLWWLNGQQFSLAPGAQAPRQDGPLIKAAPADLLAMLGAGDRKLYLVPSLDLVVTRLGFTGGSPDSSFNEAFWTALIKAAPSAARTARAQ